MKCSLDQFDNSFKILLLKAFLVVSVFTVESVSQQGNDLLKDFDYLVSQLYLQHCTFVEIGEGLCSLFVELTLDNGCKGPLRRQMFFGNCLCSEFRHWHLCSYTLTRLRPDDCVFNEATSCPSSSARVHRRLCDVTGMSQWNEQCNCSVPLAGTKQEHMCGFKTCYASPLPRSICGPRTVCGTAHCGVSLHGSLYSVRCDRRCRYRQPFCEPPNPDTGLKREVTSQWAEWRALTPPDANTGSQNDCNIQQYETECLDRTNQPAFDCLGPGLLCCGKEDSDCTCEVKVQDGKLKAFRYMINFGDTGGQCNNYNSKLKVRSIKPRGNTGMRSAALTGDAKVWNRFVGEALREDKKDSISMFGKPPGIEEYHRKNNRPVENKNLTGDSILQKLVMLVTNRSQTEKHNEFLNISDYKGSQGNSLDGGLSNGTKKLGNSDSQQTPSRRVLDSEKSSSVEDKHKINSNVSQKNTIPNNLNNDQIPNLQSQQKDSKQNDDNENNSQNLTPLPYINTTKQAEISQRSSSIGQIIPEAVRNKMNHDNIKAITDLKNSEGQSRNNKGVNTNQTVLQTQNNSVTNHKNIEKANYSMVNTSASNVPVISVIQNMINQKNMVSSLKESNVSENAENKLDDSPLSLKSQFQNSKNTSEPKKVESAVNEVILQSNSNDNHQNMLPEIKNITDEKEIEGVQDDKEIEEMSGNQDNTEKNNKENKNGDKDRENNSLIQKIIVDSISDNIVSDDQSPDIKSNIVIQNSQEKNSKDDSKINIDVKNENKQIISLDDENIESNSNKHESQVDEILNENEANGQENNQEEEKERTELEGSENPRVAYPVREPSINESKKKEEERLMTSKLVNQGFAPKLNSAARPSTTGQIPTERAIVSQPTQHLVSQEITRVPLAPASKEITEGTSKSKELTKGTSITMSYLPTATLSQTKQPNITYIVSNIKTVDSNHKEVNQVSSKGNQMKLTEPKSQNSSSNQITKPGGMQPKSTSPAAMSSQNNGHYITGKALVKKTNLNEIANILPNYTPYGLPPLPSKRKPRPHFLDEDKENGITMNIKKMSTPDLLGSFAKKLFKSHSSLNDPNDPFRMLSESNPPISFPEEKPSHDYDEPEPVLKDLNKVDKENVDEKMAEALTKIADLKYLPGKVEWSEKSVDQKRNLEFDKGKKIQDKESVNPSSKLPSLNVGDVKKKRLRNKLKRH